MIKIIKKEHSKKQVKRNLYETEQKINDTIENNSKNIIKFKKKSLRKKNF
jgi:hypothetical protein